MVGTFWTTPAGSAPSCATFSYQEGTFTSFRSHPPYDLANLPPEAASINPGDYLPGRVLIPLPGFSQLFPDDPHIAQCTRAVFDGLPTFLTKALFLTTTQTVSETGPIPTPAAAPLTSDQPAKTPGPDSPASQPQTSPAPVQAAASQGPATGCSSIKDTSNISTCSRPQCYHSCSPAISDPSASNSIARKLDIRICCRNPNLDARRSSNYHFRHYISSLSLYQQPLSSWTAVILSKLPLLHLLLLPTSRLQPISLLHQLISPLSSSSTAKPLHKLTALPPTQSLSTVYPSTPQAPTPTSFTTPPPSQSLKSEPPSQEPRSPQRRFQLCRSVRRRLLPGASAMTFEITIKMLSLESSVLIVSQGQAATMQGLGWDARRQ